MKTHTCLHICILSLMLLNQVRPKSAAYIFGYLLHNPIPDLEASNSLRSDATSDAMMSDQAAPSVESLSSLQSSSTISSTQTEPPKKEKSKKKMHRRLRKKHIPSSSTTMAPPTTLPTVMFSRLSSE